MGLIVWTNEQVATGQPLRHSHTSTSGGLSTYIYIKRGGLPFLGCLSTGVACSCLNSNCRPDFHQIGIRVIALHGLKSFSAGIDFRRQTLTRLKSIPALKDT